jgi:hypothetical protein
MKRSTRRRFAYKLAAKLGVVNVERDILNELTAKQFLTWQHADELDNLVDEERMDYRFASVVQAILNVNRAKGQKAYSLKDCLLKFGEVEQKPRQTQAQQLAILKLWAAAQASDILPPKVIEDAPSVTPGEQAALEKARAAMQKAG